MKRLTLALAVAATLALSACGPANQPGPVVPERGGPQPAPVTSTPPAKPERPPGVYHDIVIRPDGRPSVVITVIRPRPLPEPPVKSGQPGSIP